MTWAARSQAPLRHEAHFGDRVVRCFARRPPDTFSLLEASIERVPERDALVAGDTRLRYRELGEWVERLAAHLFAGGIGAGARVAIVAGNCAEFAIAALAVLRLGAIAVPIGTRLAAEEVRYILEHSGAQATIFEAGMDELVHAAMAPRPMRCGGRAGEVHFDDLGNASPPAPARQVRGEEETAVLLYTSGTTGRPKGAMLSHLNICHSVTHFRLAHELGEAERSLLAVPASHVTGLVAILLAIIGVGGTVVMLPAFSARGFLALAAAERITHTVLVPAMYNLCLRDPELGRHDLSTWRVGSYGGAPMPEAAIVALARALPNLTLINGYGATETASPASMTPPGEGLRRRETVGMPLHCADILIVDRAGRELPPGETGEIWIRGPMVVKGYWNDPAATQAGFTAGFWHSGDVGKFDGDGYLRLVDRLKDVINRGGYKVYSVEVEDALSRHPAVAECAVIAKPCEVLGERVHAFVSRRDGGVSAGDLSSFCARQLADYKVPESFTLLDAPLPRNGAGKVLKRQLRATLDASSKATHG
jgi:acyl-CoA synthetase (AMP-forming)/AMP-acid ligase II